MASTCTSNAKIGTCCLILGILFIIIADQTLKHKTPNNHQFLQGAIKLGTGYSLPDNVLIWLALLLLGLVACFGGVSLLLLSLVISRTVAEYNAAVSQQNNARHFV